MRPYRPSRSPVANARVADRATATLRTVRRLVHIARDATHFKTSIGEAFAEPAISVTAHRGATTNRGCPTSAVDPHQRFAHANRCAGFDIIHERGPRRGED